MKIMLIDHSGHAFTVELSRALAHRGHQVMHVYSKSFQSPRGNLNKLPSDSENLEISSVSIEGEFKKDNFVKRRSQEVETGKLLAAKVKEFKPDVIIAGVTPLDALKSICKAAKSVDAKFIFWLQDIFSAAIRKVVPKKLPVVGHFIGWYYHNLEMNLLRSSDHVVSITDDFVPILEAQKISEEKITVIENWATLENNKPVSRENDWVKENMPDGDKKIVYSGTLGYKHNPDLLLKIAEKTEAHVYVFSEGNAAQGLKEKAAKQGVSNLHVKSWVAFEDLPLMLSGADIFIAMIEKEAGVMSVPSKVLTYLCMERPIVAAISEGNLARKIVERENAGLVVSPDDEDGLVEAVKKLLSDQDLSLQMGKNGRRYAEENFDLDVIADRFEKLFSEVL